MYLIGQTRKPGKPLLCMQPHAAARPGGAAGDPLGEPGRCPSAPPPIQKPGHPLHYAPPLAFPFLAKKKKEKRRLPRPFSCMLNKHSARLDRFTIAACKIPRICPLFAPYALFGCFAVFLGPCCIKGPLCRFRLYQPGKKGAALRCQKRKDIYGHLTAPGAYFGGAWLPGGGVRLLPSRACACARILWCLKCRYVYTSFRSFTCCAASFGIHQPRRSSLPLRLQ